MTPRQRPPRERAELALTATFAWRDTPTALFSPALRVQVGRILNGIDEIEAAVSGLRSRNSAGALACVERVGNALATLSQSLITARSVAGSQMLLINSVESAFRATHEYVEGVSLVLGQADAANPGA